MLFKSITHFSFEKPQTKIGTKYLMVFMMSCVFTVILALHVFFLFYIQPYDKELVLHVLAEQQNSLKIILKKTAQKKEKFPQKLAKQLPKKSMQRPLPLKSPVEKKAFSRLPSLKTIPIHLLDFYVLPEYPQIMAQFRIGCLLKLKVIVQKGFVTEVFVENINNKEINHRKIFEEAAQNAILQWKFKGQGSFVYIQEIEFIP